MTIFDIHFLQDIYLYLFFIVPILLFLYIKQENKKNIKMLIWEDIKKIYGKNNLYFYIKVTLIFLILSIFILLLSDPNKINIKQDVKKNGIDIVLVLDVSKSMEAVDLKPNRIEKAKEVISDFIEKQKTNRVWLVVFAWKPYSSIPLTFDYGILIESLENISTDSLNQNVSWLEWTAVWDALLLWKNLFKKEEAREKVIILLTDWDANKWVDPIVVSKLLAEEKIKIYTIWIGWKNWGIIEVNNWFFSQKVNVPPLNEWPLKEIAKNTDWYFFRATDNETIEKIFLKLEELEKNDIEIKVIKNSSDYYNPFIYLLIFMISILLLLETKRVKN